MNIRTLTDLLTAIKDVENTGVTIIKAKSPDTFIPYKILYRQARKVLFHFQEAQIPIGAEIVMQTDRLENFISVFWAAILGGYIPVPFPVRAGKESMNHLAEIWKQLRNPRLVTDNGDAAQIKPVKPNKTIHCDSLLPKGQRRLGKPVRRFPGDIAFIQYSAGSTGKPKGVVLTHRNIISNLDAILEGMHLTASDTSLSWMPLVHDMGLIGFHLAPVAARASHYLMPVSLFAARPLLWFDYVTRYNVSILGSPDFGLRLFLAIFKPEKKYDWDLSSVRLIFNGAEPIHHHICRDFIRALKPYRLNPNVIFPVYGLAEASLAVTFPPPHSPLRPVTVDRHLLAPGNRVKIIEYAANTQNREPDDEHCISFIDVGCPVNGCRIRIAGPGENTLEPLYLGRIHIRGTNVTQSYYNNPDITRKIISTGQWLDTGDLGFLTEDNHLVVTGRENDAVQVNGQNFYFHDLERIAAQVEGIKAQKIAFASVYHPEEKKDAVTAFIAYRRPLDTFIPLARKLADHIRKKTGFSLPLRQIIPVPRIPLTASGKRMRYLLVRGYQQGTYNEIINALKPMPQPSAPVSRRRSGPKRLALLFPGQGSQHTGMGQELCKYFPVADRTFEEASDTLNIDLKKLCFDSSLQELTRTENAQPALLTLSVAKFRVFQQELGITPTLAAGHSLGEYSALTCANAISFSSAVKLVRRRGELMQQACQIGSGGMMAISGIYKDAVQVECQSFTDPGHLAVVANINAATQTVISGHPAALEEAARRLTQKGARVIPLKVSAAFHSPLMEPSAAAFAEELDNTVFRIPAWPVIANINALPYKSREEIPALLKKQLTSPIQWMATMDYMKTTLIDVAIELGPKHVLKNLLLKSSRDISVYSTNTEDDLQLLYDIDPEDYIDKRPNIIERCMAMAVSTPNLSDDDSQYTQGVIEPYRRLKQLFQNTQEDKRDPETAEIRESLELLRNIFATKKIPVQHQEQRLNRIMDETETDRLLPDLNN